MVDESGNPVAGATVTLSRSDGPLGPFTVVPNGDPTMSPMNRTNPDTTAADGHFGWDVIGGYYQIRVEKAGCTDPNNPSVDYVDSPVLQIPPSMAGLKLILNCGSASSWPTNLVGRSRPPAYSSQGFYFGVTHDFIWTLEATQPHRFPGHIYAGTIHLNNGLGYFYNVTSILLEPNQHDAFKLTGRTITFSFEDFGDIDGIQFYTSAATASITFTLDIDGVPATSSQIFLGETKARPGTGSPLTFAR